MQTVYQFLDGVHAAPDVGGDGEPLADKGPWRVLQLYPGSQEKRRLHRRGRGQHLPASLRQRQQKIGQGHGWLEQGDSPKQAGQHRAGGLQSCRQQNRE